jgi:hypothetical protein
LIGSVTAEAGGAAIQDAQVTACQASVERTIFTNPSGTYSIAGVVGYCTIHVCATGYESEDRCISIAENPPERREDFELASQEGEGEGEGDDGPGCFGGRGSVSPRKPFGGALGDVLLMIVPMLALSVSMRRKLPRLGTLEA